VKPLRLPEPFPPDVKGLLGDLLLALSAVAASRSRLIASANRIHRGEVLAGRIVALGRRHFHAQPGGTERGGQIAPQRPVQVDSILRDASHLSLPPRRFNVK
jgi:hypothetical protein